MCIKHNSKVYHFQSEHFLRLHSKRRDRPLARISPEAMSALMSHDWPGNVRELSNAVERASVLAEGEEVLPEHLLHYRFVHPQSERPRPARVRTLAEVERVQIEMALRESNGNKRRAAEMLGIDRKTLWRKLRRYGSAAR